LDIYLVFLRPYQKEASWNLGYIRDPKSRYRIQDEGGIQTLWISARKAAVPSPIALHWSPANASLGSVGDAIDNSPITPETSSSWTIFRFLLALLIIAAMMYFFLHR